MSRKVTVLLLEDIQSLGKAGDIVTVSEGHARNFLFPEGKAALADVTTRTRAAQQQASKAAQAEKELEELQVFADRLEGTELTLPARLKEDEGNEIFGSITAAQIAQKLNEEAKLTLKPKDVKLARPITHIGSQDITVQLSPDVETKIRVTVTAHEEA
jgi:ribosomal protein L9